MIDALTAAAALLLGASGLGKLSHPEATAAMLVRLLHRPARDRGRTRVLSRLAGGGEVAVGLAVLITGARPALALLAAAYLLFAAVAVALLRAGQARTSCGCFGRAESPLGPAHLVLVAVASVTALVALARPPGPGCGLLDPGGTTAAVGSAQAGLLAALGYLAVTSLPALLAARRALAPTSQEPR